LERIDELQVHSVGEIQRELDLQNLDSEALLLELQRQRADLHPDKNGGEFADDAARDR